ncbi:hypothetical protein SUGI_0680360 [Cryptomeria japonica]|nr:hypothetical protein SUGI_0680360 [Cryptomeria japonica]
MLVYDITKRQTFDHVVRWLEELRGHADNNIVIMLIGNKCDLTDKREVPIEDAQEFSQIEGLFSFETSALEETNVEDAFMKVLTEIYKTISRKVLTANEEQRNGNATSLTGTKIVLPSPVQEVNAKKNNCCILT